MTDLFVTVGASGGTGTEGSPYTMAEATANVTNTDKVWVKAGTYSVNDSASSSVMDIDVAGLTTFEIVWEGYTTTTGDFTIGDTQPVVIDADTNSLTNAMQSNAAYNVFIGLRFTGASSNGVDYGSTDNAGFIGCKFDNNGARGFSGDNNNLFFGCEFTGNTSGGLHSDNDTSFIACKVHNEAVNSVIIAKGVVAYSLFYNNGNGKSLAMDGNSTTVIGNTFDGDNQAASIGFGQSGSSNFSFIVANNIFFDCNEGVTVASGSLWARGYNLFFSCNTDYADFTNAATDVSAASDPFTDSGNRVYTLKSGSEAIDAGIDAGNLA